MTLRPEEAAAGRSSGRGARRARTPRRTPSPAAGPPALRPGELAEWNDPLHAYLREVAPAPVLSHREHLDLAEELARHTGALREAVLGTPFAARFAVERWRSLRDHGRVTATLSAVPADRRGRDASARMDRALSHVEQLLARRDRLGRRRDAASQRERKRLDETLQRALQEAALSQGLVLEVRDALRERAAQLSRPGLPARRRRELEDELGISAAGLRRRMEEIEASGRALEAVRNRFAQHNLRLVVKVAREFRDMGLPLSDLIQEGNLGLLHAVEKFDPSMGFRFSTYAVWWIRQSVIRAIQNYSRTVRLPSHVYDRILRLQRTRRSLAPHLDHDPTPAELAAELGGSEREVEELLEVMREPASLDEPVGEDEDTPRRELTSDPTALDPADHIHAHQLQRSLGELLGVLPLRERRVIAERFGLEGEPPRRLQAIGERIGLSRERVRQIEQKALQRLRSLAVARGLGEVDEDEEPEREAPAQSASL
jgi:RNA polymerase sigma factor (sigma-70 family)